MIGYKKQILLEGALASLESDWFNLWPYDKPLPEFISVWQSLDAAVSEKTTADYSCLMTFGLFKFSKEDSAKLSIMVLDCFMERVPYPELRDKIISEYQNKYGANDCPVSAVLIEDKSAGSQLLQEFRNSRVYAVPYEPKGLDKVSRANLCSHLVRDGYMWLPESKIRKGYPMSWLSAWYEQMLYFPNVKHDDGVDATTQFLNMMNKLGKVSGKKVAEKPSYWRRNMVASPYG